MKFLFSSAALLLLIVPTCLAQNSELVPELSVHFGGTHTEFIGSSNSLCKVASGGYVWVGSTGSADGDVPGNNSDPVPSAVPAA